MSECKKCDRCGTMYENYTGYSTNKKDMNGVAVICVNSHGTAYLTIKDKAFDLCEECLESFKNWWDENKITLSDECIKEFETNKNCRPPEERTDAARCDVNENPDPIIIQEPESDGEKYGY